MGRVVKRTASEKARLLQVRAVIGRMHIPRKQDMTPEEQRLFRLEFRACYARFAERQHARGLQPWPKRKYYYHWWTLNKANFIRWDIRRRTEAFLRGAA